MCLYFTSKLEEFVITVIVPKEVDLEQLPEVTKVINGQKFVRRGCGRRQDHGTSGNTCDKGHNRRYGDYYWRGADEAPLAVVRRIFLRGGTPEME